MLYFRRTNNRPRLAIVTRRAFIGRAAQIGLDLIVHRPVDISSVDVGVKHGLIVVEILGAGGALGQIRPVRRNRRLGRHSRDWRGGARGLIAATGGYCGEKNPRRKECGAGY
jgi:hypothetical protein